MFPFQSLIITKSMQPYKLKYNFNEKSTQIGYKIRQARLDKGMSEGEVGKILGVTHACIGSYERGRLRVSVDLINEFSRILEKPLDYFFEPDPELEEKYKKKKKVTYDLDDNIDFAMQLSIKHYLFSKKVTNL